MALNTAPPLGFRKSCSFIRHRQNLPSPTDIDIIQPSTHLRTPPRTPRNAGKMTAVATPPTFHISFDGPAGMTFPSFPSDALEGGNTKNIMLEMIRNACNM